MQQFRASRGDTAEAVAPRVVRLQPGPSFVPFAKREIEQSIPLRFEQQVEKYAQRLAVKDGDRTLTYSELNRAANRVAHAIISRSDTSQTFVAVFLQPGFSSAIALLGILKAGKCYVPLDPNVPPTRLAGILKEVEASLLITDDRDISVASSFVRNPSDIVNISTLEAELSTDNPAVSVTPDSPAYFFFTSGSTGLPKGVVQTHRNVLHQIMSYTNGLMLSAEDRITQLFSNSFSASRLDIFGTLLNGAALYPLLPAREGMSGLACRLIDERITVVHWVPTAFRHFVDALNAKEQFPHLRLLVLGSEPLTSHDVDLYKQHFPADCVLVNRFGSTETGNISWYFLDKQTEVPTGTAPVGYAIEDAEVLLLDEAGGEIGNNREGEIAVKSTYLPLGYWRQPDLTGDKFLSVPGMQGTVIYRTGDMGRRLAGGCLLHVGRKDFQLKIRGYRVDPGEVEGALLEHPDVTGVAVGALQGDLQDTSLVAYYVAGNSAPASGTLRKFLENRLPSYMVPAVFMRLEALPLNENGKLDRKALPAPATDLPQPVAPSPSAEPQTGVQETLTAIWSSVLGVQSVGIHDNLFDLGGNSLHAMMIISRAISTFGTEVAIPDFLELPTVSHLAEIIGGTNLKSEPDSEIEAMLDLVESLSDEEVRKLLKEETEQ